MSTNQTNQSYNVVLGVTGGLGAAIARELITQDKSVIGINKSGNAHPMLVPQEVDVRSLDVWNRQAILPILEKAEQIYQCINIPYSSWKSDLLPLTEHLVSLFEDAGVPVAIADNLYMYSEKVREPRSEDMPYTAEGTKGRIRAKVAQYYRQAHVQGRIEMVLVRGPDYYGPGALDTSYYGDRVFSEVIANNRAAVMGDLDMPHTIIYVDDFARAMILLAEHPDHYGQAWHAPSAEAVTQEEFTAIAYRQAGFTPIPPRSIKKWMLFFAGIFNRDIREIREMMYEFENPYLVDHSKFMNAFPDFEITPLDTGISHSLDWYRGYLNSE